MSRFQGILFDFDGVLARTMEDNFEAWRAAMKEYGFAIFPDDYYPLEGAPLREIALLFCRKNNLDSSRAEEIVRKKEAHYFARMNGRSVEFYPGVEDLIDQLHKRGVPMAIVSAGLRERLTRSVPPSFLKKFQAIVTGEDTPRGKPHPDPYLKGAELLGLQPSECIVVENAPLGIQSAKSAGAYCIAIASTMGSEKLQEADVVVDEFRNLPKVPSLLGFLTKQDDIV